MIRALCPKRSRNPSSKAAAKAPPPASPKESGYSVPDEWEPRDGTMMIFPRQCHYGRNKIVGLRTEFCDIAKAIASHEPVHVFCVPSDANDCQDLLEDTDHIKIHEGDYTIDWARDNAPVVMRSRDNTRLAAAGFRCNGWGKKYRGWKKDAHTKDHIASAMGLPTIGQSELTLEGGAIEICHPIGIVTESCLLNQNRNPQWTKQQVEDELKQIFGLDKIIWLKSGLVPDKITDGHVDGIVKWISKDTVLLHTIADEFKTEDPKNYKICRDAKQILLSHDIKVIELPLMEDMVHMNFYSGLCNDGQSIAYVPICGDPEQDDPCLGILREHFSTVVPILATHLSKAGGGIHCYTQPIPKPMKNNNAAIAGATGAAEC